MASNFRAHGNLFLCAQKKNSMRTKISRLPHSALMPCLKDIVFLASQLNFRAEGRGFLWARKLVLESFWGEAESFLERKECVDEEDGLRLGADSAEGKVVSFGDKPCSQQGFALSALEERASGGEVARFGLDENVGVAGIGDGAVGADEEWLFVVGKLGLHPVEETSVSVLIAVLEAIGKRDGAQCAYRSLAVGDEADGREPSEAVLEREAVGRGGEDLLSREVSLDFPPRGGAKETL